MTANMENSAVATGLEKVSFHSNAKEYSMCLLSHFSQVQLFGPLWTAARQAPLSMRTLLARPVE